jgi:hypothetical protein
MICSRPGEGSGDQPAADTLPAKCLWNRGVQEKQLPLIHRVHQLGNRVAFGEDEAPLGAIVDHRWRGTGGAHEIGRPVITARLVVPSVTDGRVSGCISGTLAPILRS